MTTRKNPFKIGKHPDLLSDRHPVTDVVVKDWRMAGPGDLLRAAAEGLLKEDDLGEISEYGSGENADVERMLEDGISRKLAQALVDDLHSELCDLDEKGRAERVQPFIRFFRERALAQIEYEIVEGNDGYNNNCDAFQSDLDRAAMPVILKAVEEAFERDNAFERVLGGVRLEDIENIEEILHDPANWRVFVHSGYGRVPGTVWSYKVGSIHDQTSQDDELSGLVLGGEYCGANWGERGRAFEAGERDPNILNALHGGTGEPVMYPGLGQEDIAFAIKELENEPPYIYFENRRWDAKRGERETPTPEFFVDRSVDYKIEQHAEDSWVAVPDEEKMLAAFAEALQREVPESGPENDDVVYTYSARHNSIAGPDVRGMYVAELSPEDLRREGAKLRHCIGTEGHGHPRALRDGKTKVFSVRTESGKPKFTIELEKHGIAGQSFTDLWRVGQVKGVANRVPGFASSDSNMTKPVEVRAVTEFLLHLGFAPEYLRTVRDLAPGLAAMEEKGTNPFVPPPQHGRSTKTNPTRNPTRIPTSPWSSRALLARVRPMGVFRG